jgi:hypothetical protein
MAGVSEGWGRAYLDDVVDVMEKEGVALYFVVNRVQYAQYAQYVRGSRDTRERQDQSYPRCTSGR